MQNEIKDSYQIVRMALDSYVTATQYALCDLGKRCSEKFIYKQMQPSADIRYFNFLAVFKLWLGAVVLSGNLRGAELIMNDVELFLRKVKKAVTHGTQFPSLSDTERQAILNDAIFNLKRLEWV